MPLELDPHWEYWTPDPEIAEVMGTDRPDGFDGLPWAKCKRSRWSADIGFRFGVETRGVDYPHLRFGREKATRPDRRPDKRCRRCERLYTPDKDRQIYCSVRCRYDAEGIRPRACAVCYAVFKPGARDGRYCSYTCMASGISAGMTGKPRRNDWEEIVSLYLSGLRVTDVAERVGVSRGAVRVALVRRGVYRGPGKCGTKRVLADVPCKKCGVMFRPYQDKQRTYCTRSCMASARGWVMVDVRRAVELKADGWGVVRIARELGCTEGGVRGAIKRHKRRAENARAE
jgi:hypothetical protein